jgi:xanthine dehydrogenase YagR molybdenum-binding subunit
MADYHWPPAGKRELIGKPISRIDGPWKASGTATYTYDVHREGMLFGRMVLCPHAHAKVTSIDTSAAEKMPGVKAIQISKGYAPGDDGPHEVLFAGQEIVAIAAENENQARDAAKAIRVEYEILPHLVLDTTPEKAGADFVKPLAENTGGDSNAAMQTADVVHQGDYGANVITHCCLEAHGQVCEWNGDHLTVWASTQNVSGIGGEYSQALGIPATNVEIITPVMGGGFGSKFAADRWGILTAQLAKTAGRPVKMMLERDQELSTAGCRPSLYGRVKIGAKHDGTMVAWESESWGTSGPQPGGNAQLPYIFRDHIPYHTKHTSIQTNIGPARAWRAPNHPQFCSITFTAFEDLAAKLNMDPVDFLLKNLPLLDESIASGAPGGGEGRGRGQQPVGTPAQMSRIYREELLKASELMDWKKKWHQRGDKTSGPIKTGLGVAMHTWGGRGHQSNCNCVINPDGSAAVSLGSQDLGTGNRTLIGIVAAETFGLPLEGVQVNIGDSKYPPSGASGGSTTSGGVSSSTRLACTQALNQLLEKVAPSLDAKPGDLVAWGGKIQVASNPSKSLTWKQACAKLGNTPINLTASNNNAQGRELMSQQVGGVQMAEVNVDVETGVVKMVKMVAVQDCGLVIDLKTSMSQVYGACIMGVTYALHEEKVMDQQTGRHLNANMEFYKLAGINDIGELVVHMMTGPGYDERGVIGLAEPPTVSPGAAISNAVANAIGVRVREIPLTPDRVLAALSKGAMA